MKPKLIDRREFKRHDVEIEVLKYKDKHNFSEDDILNMKWNDLQNLRSICCSTDEDKTILRHEMYRSNIEEYKLKRKIRHENTKKQVLAHYSSGTFQCACCGESHIEFLTIDHIKGGNGKKHKKEIGGHFYHWLIKNNFPSGYQVLCWNCNKSKSTYEYCSHIKKKIYTGNNILRKKKVIEYYSNNTMNCICCQESDIDFLCIDHINGGGNKDRKNNKNFGYGWLITHKFPPGYRVLCHNCNSSLGHFNYCPHGDISKENHIPIPLISNIYEEVNEDIFT
jgi:hypothetical protein